MDSDDNIYLKISRMIEEKLDRLENKLERLFKESSNDYKTLWEKTERQQSQIDSLDRFQNKYEPIMDKVDRKIYTISIIVPVIITLVAGVIFAYIQRGVIG